MNSSIVLKNIRKDIEAVKPLAANVVSLQRQLLEAVRCYHDLIADTNVDDEAVRNLREEISTIDYLQRVELNRIREAEITFLQEEGEEEAEISKELLQEGSQVPEEAPDMEEKIKFLSSIGLVHVKQHRQIKESSDQQKLMASDGKRVYSPGPWQIMEPPTKVFLRSKTTNESAGVLPFYVSIKPKNPLQQLTKMLASPTTSDSSSNCDVRATRTVRTVRARTTRARTTRARTTRARKTRGGT